jgi:hypothetical protein
MYTLFVKREKHYICIENKKGKYAGNNGKRAKSQSEKVF